MARNYKGSRSTKETQIEVKLDLESHDYSINTGIGFLDHMLELFAHHGSFGLELKAKGDTHICRRGVRPRHEGRARSNARAGLRHF